MGGFTTNTIIAPIPKIPKNGYKSIGFIPSKEAGKRLVILRKANIRYPAKKPAASAPKKPDGCHISCGKLKDRPVLAKNPPTIPGIKAGRSAIAMAMYPAKIGNIIPNAKPPIWFKKEDSGFAVPNCGVPALALSNKKESAISLLEKTNCMFLVDVKYYVDSIEISKDKLNNVTNKLNEYNVYNTTVSKEVDTNVVSSSVIGKTPVEEKTNVNVDPDKIVINSNNAISDDAFFDDFFGDDE